jgi:hypothetical protein
MVRVAWGVLLYSAAPPLALNAGLTPRFVPLLPGPSIEFCDSSNSTLGAATGAMWRRVSFRGRLKRNEHTYTGDRSVSIYKTMFRGPNV